jgi:hypothetical protein
VLMFFYLCADVTVLEYFCGNPSLGIPSYSQVIEVKSQPIEASSTSSTQGNFNVSRSSKDDRETDIPLDGDDCFCCSSHATISYNYLIISLIPVISRRQRETVFSNPQDHSDWHLPPSYRPPRIA